MGIHILVLIAIWRWTVSFTPRPLYPRKGVRSYSLNKRLDGPQNRCEEAKRIKILPLPGLEMEGFAVQPVASRYPGSS
jgi:hypothetical protein